MPMLNSPQCSPAPCQNNLDVLKEIVNDGLPVVHVFPFKLACISYLLFDIEELFIDENSTATELQLKVKMLGNGAIVPVYTDDDCGMQRWEEIHTFDYATVNGAVANSPIVILDDITLLKGIGVGSKIRFQTTTSPGTPTSPATKIGIITAISGNQITLDGNITLNDGDRAFRGGNLRLLCAPINNQYNLNKRCKYISYFQSIQGRLNFKTCELSMDRAVYSMGKNPQMLVNAKMNALFQGLLQNEFIDMFLYGANVPEDENAGIVSQTRGLITSIQDAQICNGVAYIIDLADIVGGSCVDPDGNCSDELVITVLIEYFVKAFESGYYNNEPILAAINGQQLKNLMYMAPSLEEYFGIQMYKESKSSHQGCMDYVSLRVHGIEIEHGSIEFVLFEPLTHFFPDTSIMILMPRSMFGIYQRKFSKLDSNMHVVNDTTYPKFVFKDISDKINLESGGDECFAFITKIQLAFAQAGVYNGAYYIIKNANSYKNALGSGWIQSDMVQIVS